MNRGEDFLFLCDNVENKIACSTVAACGGCHRPFNVPNLLLTVDAASKAVGQ